MICSPPTLRTAARLLNGMGDAEAAGRFCRIFRAGCKRLLSRGREGRVANHRLNSAEWPKMISQAERVWMRLDRVAGKQTVRLTHYGRKSGKPYEVTIRFVADGGRVHLGTANVSRNWVQNVQKTPSVKLSIGGETFDATARFLTDRHEHERVQEKMRKK